MKRQNQDLHDEIDTKNRTIWKTLIFRKIIQERKENWAESKSTLAQEINKVMPERQLGQILSKIESVKNNIKSQKCQRIIVVFFD